MISIIVPVYKVEKYLPKCIESLMVQTNHDIEIILVDDGSPDGCGRICDEYAVRDSRIKVIHQQNAGVSVARNAGLRAASGEYIGFCDPDDWTAPEMYGELLRAMNDFSVDLSVCGYNYYDEDYRVDARRIYKEKQTELLDQKTLMDRMADMPPSIRHGVCNKLFKKSLLQDQRFREGLHSSEDVLFLTEYILKTKHAAIVHKPLYQNLVRLGSATHGGLSIKNLADSIYAHEYMYTSVVQAYPELKNRAMAFLLDVCTLKYKAAKRKMMEIPLEEQMLWYSEIKKIRKIIHAYARSALLNNTIFWKTRIAYLIIK